jgi:recombination protein RecA
MRAAISKVEIESELASRFGSAVKLHEKRPAEVLSTGIPQIDSFTFGGLPRGAVTEIFGPASSGRTSFLFSALAHATEHQEICALVDTNNSFDPESASQAEINFERLLWIRCANNLEHAFKSTDLLLQGGGFGLVVLDLGDVAAKEAKRIISSWWYRFRRTVENTPTALVVMAQESCVRSCATLALELNRETWLWSSSSERLKPVRDGVINRVNKGDTRALSLSRSLSSVPTPAVQNLRRRMYEGPLSHSHLLQGLNFQVECRRPLYLNRREQDVLIKVCKANC